MTVLSPSNVGFGEKVAMRPGSPDQAVNPAPPRLYLISIAISIAY